LPIYEFHCTECGKTESIMCSYNERDSRRPVCARGEECKTKNTIYTPGLKLEGQGWYTGGSHVSSRKK